MVNLAASKVSAFVCAKREHVLKFFQKWYFILGVLILFRVQNTLKSTFPPGARMLTTQPNFFDA